MRQKSSFIKWYFNSHCEVRLLLHFKTKIGDSSWRHCYQKLFLKWHHVVFIIIYIESVAISIRISLKETYSILYNWTWELEFVQWRLNNITLISFLVNVLYIMIKILIINTFLQDTLPIKATLDLAEYFKSTQLGCQI